MKVFHGCSKISCTPTLTCIFIDSIYVDRLMYVTFQYRKKHGTNMACIISLQMPSFSIAFIYYNAIKINIIFMHLYLLCNKLPPLLGWSVIHSFENTKMLQQEIFERKCEQLNNGNTLRKLFVIIWIQQG